MCWETIKGVINYLGKNTGDTPNETKSYQLTTPKGTHFQRLGISKLQFNEFFSDTREFQDYLMVGLLFYLKYRERVKISQTDHQSKMNAFCVSYLIAIKVMHDTEEIFIRDFLDYFDMPRYYRFILIDCELEFGDAVEWRFFVENSNAYIDLCKIAKTHFDISNIVLNT